MKIPLMVLMLGLATMAQSKGEGALPAGVPAGAVAVDGANWRWVDKDGRSWLYRPTPFGMMRSEEAKQTGGKRPAGLPVEALPVGEGKWRWVDGEHKVWLYQETPSGLMKTPAPKEMEMAGAKGPDVARDPVLQMITVKEEGDMLRFSRPGPFGTYSWVRKKTQLDPDETIVWERARAKSASAKKD
jgi:hypothetical protein